MAYAPHADRAGAIPVSASETVERFERQPEARRRAPALAERASLEVVGLAFAAVTAAVILIAMLVVWNHVGKHAPERGSLAASATHPATKPALR
jgi:hypothetical protein